jgi:hypothetical protein
VRTIQKTSCATGGLHGNQAVIPVSLSSSFPIGSVMELKIGDNVYLLKVARYNEDNIFCSPMNMGTYLTFVSEKMYSDIRRWSEMPRGGHFAALEQPELLAQGIREFFRPLR